MDEFASLTRAQAAEAFRRHYGEQLTPEMDPILELVAAVLSDGTGGVISTAENLVTIDQWLAWNQLALQSPNQLSQTAMTILKREQIELPTQPTEIYNWAAWLLLATLDEIETE